MDVVHEFAALQALLIRPVPIGVIQCPDHLILIPDDLRRVVFTRGRHHGFNLGLAGDDEIAARAKTAFFVKDEQGVRFDMDHEREFPNLGRLLAFRAFAESGIHVRIQEEIVFCLGVVRSRIGFFRACPDFELRHSRI